VTEPAPALTGTELDLAIAAAAREYIAAKRAHVGAQQITDARATLDALIAARDAT